MSRTTPLPGVYYRDIPAESSADAPSGRTSTDPTRWLPMRRRTLSTLPTLICVGLAVAAPVQAQDVVLDEGTFTLTSEGSEVGSEQFTLRRVGAGDEAKIWATATVEHDGATGAVSMRPVLQTSADRTPIGYQNKVTGSEDTEVQIGVADRRFVAIIRSPRGERERELRSTPGAVFLEGTIAHQYYFLPEAPSAGGSVEVPVIVPQTGAQEEAILTTVGTETLRIAGRNVEAVRVRLTVDGQERDVWRDREGHVLRLEIPAISFRAERESL